MTRTVSQEEFAASAPDLLRGVGHQTVLIEREGKTVAALVSVEQYESTQEGRGRRAVAAMNRLSDAVQASGATEEELKELEAALDRKA